MNDIGNAGSTTSRSYPVEPPFSNESKEKCLTQLREWGTSKGYDITDIRDCFTEWFNGKDPEKILDLSNLNLDSMPPLPAGLKNLDISKNQPNCVPMKWPAGLCSLTLSEEQLAPLLEEKDMGKFLAKFFNKLADNDVVQFRLADTPLAKKLHDLIAEATDPSKHYKGPRIDIDITTNLPTMEEEKNQECQVWIT